MYAVKLIAIVIHYRLLESIQNIIEGLPIVNNTPLVIPQDSFAVAVQEVDETEFMVNPPSFIINLSGDVFGGNTSINTRDIDFGSGTATNVTAAAINLPSNLLNLFNNTTNMGPIRIANSIYFTDALFLRRDTSNMEVGSLIIAASVVGQTIVGLDPPITLFFRRNPV